MEYNFHAEQFLNVSLEEAWQFFSSAKNLEVITPPELGFKIISLPEAGEIYEGMLIDYTVRPVLGIPLHWKTEIAKVQKPYVFMDKQLKGPYKVWEHTHTFEEKDNGVLMRDHVRYVLPLGFLGRIAHYLLVKKKLNEIFEFREKVLNKKFVSYGIPV
ncbi:MAG: SRPBCC family protein [Ginsengibacter sp.]